MINVVRLEESEIYHLSLPDARRLIEAIRPEYRDSHALRYDDVAGQALGGRGAVSVTRLAWRWWRLETG